MVPTSLRSFLPSHPKIPTSSILFHLPARVGSFERSDAFRERETCASRTDRSFPFVSESLPEACDVRFSPSHRLASGRRRPRVVHDLHSRWIVRDARKETRFSDVAFDRERSEPDRRKTTKPLLFLETTRHAPRIRLDPDRIRRTTIERRSPIETLSRAFRHDEKRSLFRIFSFRSSFLPFSSTSRDGIPKVERWCLDAETCATPAKTSTRFPTYVGATQTVPEEERLDVARVFSNAFRSRERDRTNGDRFLLRETFETPSRGWKEIRSSRSERDPSRLDPCSLLDELRRRRRRERFPVRLASFRVAPNPLGTLRFGCATLPFSTEALVSIRIQSFQAKKIKISSTDPSNRVAEIETARRKGKSSSSARKDRAMRRSSRLVPIAPRPEGKEAFVALGCGCPAASEERSYPKDGMGSAALDPRTCAVGVPLGRVEEDAMEGSNRWKDVPFGSLDPLDALQLPAQGYASERRNVGTTCVQDGSERGARDLSKASSEGKVERVVRFPSREIEHERARNVRSRSKPFGSSRGGGEGRSSGKNKRFDANGFLICGLEEDHPDGWMEAPCIRDATVDGMGSDASPVGSGETTDERRALEGRILPPSDPCRGMTKTEGWTKGVDPSRQGSWCGSTRGENPLDSMEGSAALEAMIRYLAKDREFPSEVRDKALLALKGLRSVYASKGTRKGSHSSQRPVSPISKKVRLEKDPSGASEPSHLVRELDRNTKASEASLAWQERGTLVSTAAEGHPMRNG